MSALRAVWRVLADVPGIVYVAALAGALIAGGIYSVYRYGRAMEHRAIETKARADSIGRAVLVARDKRAAELRARAATDSARALTKLATKSADSARATRRIARAEAEPVIASWPPLAIELVHADDEALRADSIALQAHVAAQSRWLVERFVADSAYTAEEQVVRLQGTQIATLSHTGPGKLRTALWFAGGFLSAVVLTFAVAAAR